MNLMGSDSSHNTIGDPLKTYRRPTCLIGDLDMFHLRLICPIGDRHALSETDLPAEYNQNFNTFKYSCFYISFCLFIYIGIVYWGMSVSERSPMKHVGLWWVSDNNNIFLNSYNCSTSYKLNCIRLQILLWKVCRYLTGFLFSNSFERNFKF